MKKIFTAALMMASVAAWAADEPAKTERATNSATAFTLAKEGNRYIGEQAKDKIVQIRSERSSGALTPSVWYVVYYDSTAALKATEVKFSNGKMMDVKRPLRLLEATSHKSEPLPKDKLKIDSDVALKIATQQGSLDNVKLVSSEMRLTRGPNDEPVWKIQLWAIGPKEPKYETPVGDVTIAAADGKVIEADLKPDKVR